VCGFEKKQIYLQSWLRQFWKHSKSLSCVFQVRLEWRVLNLIIEVCVDLFYYTDIGESLRSLGLCSHWKRVMNTRARLTWIFILFLSFFLGWQRPNLITGLVTKCHKMMCTHLFSSHPKNLSQTVVDLVYDWLTSGQQQFTMNHWHVGPNKLSRAGLGLLAT